MSKRDAITQYVRDHPPRYRYWVAADLAYQCEVRTSMVIEVLTATGHIELRHPSGAGKVWMLPADARASLVARGVPEHALPEGLDLI